MTLAQENYRNVLRSTLAARITDNPRYSLRAFAKHLGISQPYLTEILRGRKNLSLEKAHSIAEKIRLAGDAREYFLLSVQFEALRQPELKAALAEKMRALNPGREVHNLALDSFLSLSEWYHFPILEMTQIAGFHPSPENIALQLGIHAAQAAEALARLQRLGLLERIDANSYRKTNDSVLAAAKVPNEALRKFHRQMLERAERALTEQEPGEKFVGSETLAIHRQQLERVRELAEEFLQKVVGLTYEPIPKQDVYHLSLQFFRLTKGTTPL